MSLTNWCKVRDKFIGLIIKAFLKETSQDLRENVKGKEKQMKINPHEGLQVLYNIS